MGRKKIEKFELLVPKKRTQAWQKRVRTLLSKFMEACKLCGGKSVFYTEFENPVTKEMRRIFFSSGDDPDDCVAQLDDVAKTLQTEPTERYGVDDYEPPQDALGYEGRDFRHVPPHQALAKNRSTLMLPGRIAKRRTTTRTFASVHPIGGRRVRLDLRKERVDEVSIIFDTVEMLKGQQSPLELVKALRDLQSGGKNREQLLTLDAFAPEPPRSPSPITIVADVAPAPAASTAPDFFSEPPFAVNVNPNPSYAEYTSSHFLSLFPEPSKPSANNNNNNDENNNDDVLLWGSVDFPEDDPFWGTSFSRPSSPTQFVS